MNTIDDLIFATPPTEVHSVYLSVSNEPEMIHICVDAGKRVLSGPMRPEAVGEFIMDLLSANLIRAGLPVKITINPQPEA